METNNDYTNLTPAERLKKALEDPKVQAAMREHFEEKHRREAVHDKQIIHFHENYSHRLTELIEKVNAKYNTSKYVNRWYSRGIEPPRTLLYFLVEYAANYGREVTQEEGDIYANMFTTEMYVVENCDYIFQIMQGQGSAALVLTKAETKRRAEL